MQAQYDVTAAPLSSSENFASHTGPTQLMPGWNIASHVGQVRAAAIAVDFGVVLSVVFQLSLPLVSTSPSPVVYLKSRIPPASAYYKGTTIINARKMGEDEEEQEEEMADAWMIGLPEVGSDVDRHAHSKV
jgi:hypothetical protein